MSFHHIIPKSLGGSNDKSNLVLLTPEEHFAHYYLWKFTSDKPAGEWDSSVVEQCRVMDFVAPLLFNNAGAHNAIYRGKNLGTRVTAEQWAVITAGTFDDLYTPPEPGEQG